MDSVGNMFLRAAVSSMRESIPRQVDKKSGVPEEDRGVWGCQGGDKGLEFLRRRKGQTFFPLHFLVLVT